MRRWTLGFVILLAIVALTPIAVGWVWYGDQQILPGWIGNFSASLLAFIGALGWERYRTSEEAKTAADDEQARVLTEARRAFHAIAVELGVLKTSLEDAIPKLTPGQLEWWVMPNLPTGAGRALAPRLGQIVADFELIADLASLHARVDDLLWRCRYRLEHGSQTVEANATKELSEWVLQLATEVEATVDELLPQVEVQAKNPDVRPVGLLFRTAVAVIGSASVGVGGSVVTPGTESPPSATPPAPETPRVP